MNNLRNYLYLFSLMFSASLFSAPTISHIVWGEIRVTHDDGSEYTFKDAKISPSGSHEWDWDEHGTRHTPGILVDDLLSIIDKVDIIILTAGMDEKLNVTDEAVSYIQDSGKEYYRMETRKAVELYNQLVAEGKQVGILVHSTC